MPSKGPPFRFRSAVHAVAARDYLVQNGVPAQVVGGNTDASIFSVRNSGAYEVVLASNADAKLATFLLDQWSQEPVEMEGDLDDHATPNLGALDPAMAPPCPNCSALLPLDASLPACPNCGEPVDVAALIVDVHGPEALDACYESSMSSDELMQMGASCSACGGPVNDHGACGWCGRRRR
jgi:hypothetical protein